MVNRYAPWRYLLLILVIAVGAIYAAPNLIYHYVAEHHYAPPQEFVDALLHCADHVEETLRRAKAHTRYMHPKQKGYVKQGNRWVKPQPADS